MKLGEILIENRLLTEKQLDIALKSQLILGGHLGTSLTELGFIDEDTLGRTLSMICGVPYAGRELFASISPEVIRAVPLKIAEEYLAVPVKLEEKLVHLAMVNPKDLRVIDEISFAIGHRVVPCVAPEVRIYQALERYYGIALRSRYIALGHQLEDAKKLATTPGANGPSEKPELPMSDFRHEDDVPGEEHDLTFGYGKSWREVAEAIDPTANQAPTPLSKLAEQYCKAETPDDLARTALAFAVGRAERMLLMSVRGQVATVWHERGLALASEIRKEVSFQVTTEPIFHLLLGGEHFHGALPPSDDVHSFFRTLRVPAPVELLLIPIRVNDLLIAVALIDGGPRELMQGDAEEFLKAFRLFGMSITLLAMRKKILAAV